RSLHVVPELEPDRLPFGGYVTLIDQPYNLLHLAGVVTILGHILPCLLEHGPKGHPRAPLRMGFEQPLEGIEAANDVFGQDHPVNPGDQVLWPPAKYLALRALDRGAGCASLEPTD